MKPIKKANELLKDITHSSNWRDLALWSWADSYEEHYMKWTDICPSVADDRRVFINTYKQVYQAVNSMRKEPDTWVRVAINDKINEERKIMDRIISHFKNR